MSLHWGLSSRPSIYKSDALPLSYRGTYQQAPPQFEPVFFLSFETAMGNVETNCWY